MSCATPAVAYGHLLTLLWVPQVIAAAQTSVTLFAVHDGVGEKTELLTAGLVDKAFKV
jgi:hypothetical protein